MGLIRDEMIRELVGILKENFSENIEGWTEEEIQKEAERMNDGSESVLIGFGPKEKW